MKKQFNLQNFKSSASKTGGYLKNKGYNVPREILLDSLSFFLGIKNWNTMESILRNDNNEKLSINKNSMLKNNNYNNLLFNKDSSIYIIAADNQKKIDEYINKTAIPYLFENFNNKKIIQRGSNDFVQYDNHTSNLILFKQSMSEKDNNFFVKYSMRLDPDYIIINELNNQAESVIMAAITGHIVIIGIVSDSKEDIKDEIFNQLLSKGQQLYKNAILLNNSISSITYLD